jgi:hypothetical protein
MNCNMSRQPIDGIWATTGINIQQGSYLEYGGACPSDHHALWPRLAVYALMIHALLTDTVQGHTP